MELPTKENDELNRPIKMEKVNSFDLIFEQYGLNGNFFNPNKNTPPNKFVNKLEERMKKYYDSLKNTSSRKMQ